MKRLRGVVVALAFAGGCSGASAGSRGVEVDGAAPPRASAAGSSSPAGSAAPAAPAGQAARTGELPLFVAARIFSLIDLTRTPSGSIEARLGTDLGGGIHARFRFAPLLDGAPDLDRETAELQFVDSTGIGSKILLGDRPELFFHSVSGFRGAAIDNGYQKLDGLRWRDLGGGGDGVRVEVAPWSSGRLLECRVLTREDFIDAGAKALLPTFRVVPAFNAPAPSLKPDLQQRLRSEGFILESVLITPSGDVAAVGRRSIASGFGTLLWKDRLDEPRYFADSALAESEQLRFLGGGRLAEIRLVVGSDVQRLDGQRGEERWIVESTVAADRPPDVWFGQPLIQEMNGKAFVRLEAKGPWLSVPIADPDAHSLAFDGAGTLWKAEKEVLYSSRKPARIVEITEEDLVRRRQRSVLRGGSNDPAGGAFPLHPPTCSHPYVLFDERGGPTEGQDYPEIRALLRGHRELSAARLVVSYESGHQFFGAQAVDEGMAQKLEKLVSRTIPGVKAICAEPVPIREIRIDWATGKVLP